MASCRGHNTRVRWSLLAYACRPSYYRGTMQRSDNGGAGRRCGRRSNVVRTCCSVPRSAPKTRLYCWKYSTKRQSRMPSDYPQMFVALLHFPVYNKARQVVATSLTPLQRQRELARQMIVHWTQGYGATYNPTRAEALQHIHVVEHLEAVEQDILQRCGMAPRTIATDARQFPQCISYPALRQLIWQRREAFLLL